VTRDGTLCKLLSCFSYYIVIITDLQEFFYLFHKKLVAIFAVLSK